MHKNKKIKNILSCFLLGIISLILGYTIWIPSNGDNDKTNPIAVMLQQSDGTYKPANIDTLLPPAGYVLDNATCVNGSVITFENNNISIALKGNDQCTIFYNQRESDITINSITVDGSTSESFPSGTNYTVTPNCIGASATWNYGEWTLDITGSSSASATCEINFTSVSTVNYLNQHIENNTGTTQGEDSSHGMIVEENGYRYEGTDPYNYVLFNNELWRIIGVFDTEIADNVNTEKLTKIIRNESLGSYPYSSNENNYWINTSGIRNNLNILLNDYYSQSEITEDICIYSNYQDSNLKKVCDFTINGIKEQYRNMIENVIWNLGSAENALTPDEQFVAEKGNLRANETTALTSAGKIGLMYPSDYGYSVQPSDCVRTTEIKNYNESCGGKSWLLKYGLEWTMTPAYNDSTKVFNISSNGGVLENYAQIALQTRPVVYLKSNTYIVSGSGSLNDPYIINM